MWGMNTETIPVVIGNLGLQKHMEKFPGAIITNELQKITLYGSAHTLRKLSSQKQNLSALLCLKTLAWTRPFRTIQQTEQQEFT